MNVWLWVTKPKPSMCIFTIHWFNQVASRKDEPGTNLPGHPSTCFLVVFFKPKSFEKTPDPEAPGILNNFESLSNETDVRTYHPLYKPDGLESDRSSQQFFYAWKRNLLIESILIPPKRCCWINRNHRTRTNLKVRGKTNKTHNLQKQTNTPKPILFNQHLSFWSNTKLCSSRCLWSHTESSLLRPGTTKKAMGSHAKQFG